MDEVDFAGLILRVKRGENAAISELVARYEREVQIMVRHKLPTRLRGQFDTMDFAQIVWNSVIGDCRERDEPFAEPKHLLGFLAAVVQNKVYEEFRRRTKTKKYNISIEEPLYVRKGNREVPREVAADDPSPSEYVQADDRLEQLVTGRSPLERQIIELRLEGLTFDQIGARLGVHEKAVRRVIDALREMMEARRWR
jgi:RNA polymerase sigma factor (sigma-70 family)